MKKNSIIKIPLRNHRITQKKKEVSSGVKAVIFDLGNVLIGFDHRIAVRRILKYTGKLEQEIYDLFFDSGLTREFEKGKIASREFFKQVKSILQLKISYAEFLPIWNEIFFPRPGVSEFISFLNPGLTLVLLSNINKLHYDYILNTFPSAIALFGKANVIPSYITGFVKPEKEIYDLAIQKAACGRENIVYVDDRLDLVEAAQNYGIKSIRFQNVEELKREFRDLGIIKNVNSRRHEK